MARKPRLTVFSRFLLLMLIVGPLAFLGASYYNGEDGLQTVKDLFNRGESPAVETRTNRNDAPADDQSYKIRKLEEELDYKQKRLNELYEENETLKRRVQQLEDKLDGNG